MTALDSCEIAIDRVGFRAEVMTDDNLHDLLEKCISIDKFNKAKEANVSWLERVESFNVWTYISINEYKDENKIVFDVNSIPERKLSDQGVAGRAAMNTCAETLKGKMENVL